MKPAARLLRRMGALLARLAERLERPALAGRRLAPLPEEAIRELRHRIASRYY